MARGHGAKLVTALARREVARLCMVSAVAALLAALPRCTSSGDGDSRSCRPGLKRACDCPGGGRGEQACAPDGAGYLACDCADASAGDGGGAAGQSGSGGGGGGGASGTSGGGASGSAGTPSGGASGEGGASGAAGGSGAPADAGAACPAGSVTNAASGECDLVEQSCEGGLTCSVRSEDAGPWMTACVQLGAGSAPLGAPCAAHAECAPGLRCALGKCTRPCCVAEESALCGPDGACGMTIQYDQGAATLRVCTFAPSCTPWTGDCPGTPETDCHVRGGGKLECSVPNYDADAGSTLGRPCVYLNDCGDSQHCVYPSGFDSGFCRWLCKVSSVGAPPSGSVGGPPGDGGCPSGETCRGFGVPAWLGACSP